MLTEINKELFLINSRLIFENLICTYVYKFIIQNSQEAIYLDILIYKFINTIDLLIFKFITDNENFFKI